MALWVRILGWFQKITTGMNVVATVWIMVIMVFASADVLGRELIMHPILGTPEIVRWSIVAIVSDCPLS